eukprot:scaffold5671_cov105-Isochrysis_galbana.AAC.4
MDTRLRDVSEFFFLQPSNGQIDTARRVAAARGAAAARENGVAAAAECGAASRLAGGHRVTQRLLLSPCTTSVPSTEACLLRGRLASALGVSAATVAVAVDGTSTPVALELSIAAPDADAARTAFDGLRALSPTDASAALRLPIVAAEAPQEWGGPLEPEDQSPMAGRVPALSVVIGVSGWLDPGAALPTSDWWEAGGKPSSRSVRASARRAPVAMAESALTRASPSTAAPCDSPAGTGLDASGESACQVADASAVALPGLSWEEGVARAAAQAGEPEPRTAQPAAAAGLTCATGVAPPTQNGSSPDSGAPAAAALPSPTSDAVDWLVAMACARVPADAILGVGGSPVVWWLIQVLFWRTGGVNGAVPGLWAFAVATTHKTSSGDVRTLRRRAAAGLACRCRGASTAVCAPTPPPAPHPSSRPSTTPSPVPQASTSGGPQRLRAPTLLWKRW